MKMRKIFFICFLSFIVLLFSSKSIYAASNCVEVNLWAKSQSGKIYYAPNPFLDDNLIDPLKEIQFQITVQDPDPNQEYKVYTDSGYYGIGDYKSDWFTPDKVGSENILQGVIQSGFPGPFKHTDHVVSVLRKNTSAGVWQEETYCTPDDTPQLRYTITSGPTPTPSYTCTLSIDPPNITSSTPFAVLGQTSPNHTGLDSVSVSITNLSNNYQENIPAVFIAPAADGHDIEAQATKHLDGSYLIKARLLKSRGGTDTYPVGSCTLTFTVCASGCGMLTPTPTLPPSPPTPTDDPSVCTGILNCFDPKYTNCSACRQQLTPIPPVPSLAPLCDQIDSNYRAGCWNCINTGGIWTAIGCLPTDWGTLISDKIFPLGLGIAGGVAFLYFLYGVFLILTSGGNAEKIAEGKEIIISALSGLFLIIFSVFLLRVIGYDILRIPDFK